MLSGCTGGGADASGGGWDGTVRDSSGVVIVENTDNGVWASADAWTVTEELRIGTTAGDPEYQFGQISGVAALADGRIAVFDQQAQELRFFSSDGRYLQKVGGPGSGPGEFALGAGPVLVAAGDTIVVPDVTNRRVNRFAPDGTALGSFALDFTSGIPLAWLDREDGGIISQLRPLNFPGQETVADPNDVLVLRDSDGTIRDTLMVLESGGTIEISDTGAQVTFFSPEPVWATSGDGLVFGVNDEYRLNRYDESGTLTGIVSKPSDTRLVTESDQQLLLDAMVRLWEDFGITGQALEIARRSIAFADVYPAFAFVRGGPEETIWVQHLQVPSELDDEELENFNPQLGFGSPTWDVFDNGGRFLGVVEMPQRFQPVRFLGDRIYGIWRDELDVQYALVLRIEGT